MKQTEAHSEQSPAVGVLASPTLVKDLESGVAARWDRFVFEPPRGSFFHLIGWKRVIEKTFGFKARYFYCEGQGKITGVAPFFDFSNWLVGRCLISVPLAAYGGILAEDAVSEHALLDHSQSMARSAPVHYLEMRHRHAGP